ncbi:MAG: tRNA (5-methylaminomethyl-2-thiouridine)(34)-methyltransferase MnmD [Methylotenera sp.]
MLKISCADPAKPRRDNMQFANINWINNQPYSIDFNDIYFSTEGGQQETEYVFITHNQLKQRFAQPNLHHFTIIETGFGTGLNFLAVCARWLALSPPHAKLHYVSIEKYPLKLVDLQRAMQLLPQFSVISSELISKYAGLESGLNQFNLAASRIQLDLWIGDVVMQLIQISDIADAWILDGFAPAKNADMWSGEVFEHIERLSRINTTFATFTSAGVVRRGLQAVGFDVKKQAGFGKKREMLNGVFTGKSA